MSYPTPTCSWIGKRLEENALYTPKIAICVEKIMIDQWKQGHHIFSQAHIYFTCNSLLCTSWTGTYICCAVCVKTNDGCCAAWIQTTTSVVWRWCGGQSQKLSSVLSPNLRLKCWRIVEKRPRRCRNMPHNHDGFSSVGLVLLIAQALWTWHVGVGRG